MEITKSIFREYDIRGEYPNQINEEVVRKIGNAIAGKCINLNIKEICVGRDGRNSGKSLLEAMIGGLLGTQVCGKELIAGAKCEEIAIVYATIGGAALGYVTEALLGNHDGHQYIINIDDSEDNVAIVQGGETKLSNNDRVVIIFGKTIRVLPYDG